MPELPEVESVRRGLAGLVPGRRVEAVTVLHPRLLRDQPGGPGEFVDRLSGAVFGEPQRRGKFLWLDTSATASPAGTTVASLPEEALVVHLGMSGQVRVVASDTDVHPHTRVVAALDNGYDPRFDSAEVIDRLRARRTVLKRALLDQGLMSGIGNIYADESLWRARLHGDRPTFDLPVSTARRLLRHVQQVLSESIDAGGTSFDALYVNVNGESGWFGTDLAVYGRAGHACRRCGTPVRRTSFTNRSSFTCPSCQRPPRQP